MEKENTQLHEARTKERHLRSAHRGQGLFPSQLSTLQYMKLYFSMPCVVINFCPGTCTDTPGFHLLREAWSENIPFEYREGRVSIVKWKRIRVRVSPRPGTQAHSR